MTTLARKFSEEIIDCFNLGNKILVIGNGGSAAEAQHFVSELVCHFEKPRKALPAIALTTDTSILTAVGNDDGYEYVFSRQVEALGKKNDLLVILTTSGSSKNCLVAEMSARKMGLKVRYFPLKDDKSTAECQEEHLKLIHDICRMLDEYYFDPYPQL